MPRGVAARGIRLPLVSIRETDIDILWSTKFYCIFLLVYMRSLYFLSVPVYIYTYFSAKSQNKPIAAAWRAIINITLIGGLKSETTENDRKWYSLSYWNICNSTMAISIVATFWLNFMIKNTYKIIQNNTKECRNGIDCFFDNSSRIPDCRDVDSVNLRIQCYNLISSMELGRLEVYLL